MPFSSAAIFEVDRALNAGYIPPQSVGAWATIHALRPQETEAAFRGRGPLTAFLGFEPGGSVATIANDLGSVMAISPRALGALASTMGASAAAYKLPYGNV